MKIYTEDEVAWYIEGHITQDALLGKRIHERAAELPRVERDLIWYVQHGYSVDTAGHFVGVVDAWLVYRRALKALTRRVNEERHE